MEYFAYNQLIHNTLPYMDLDARVRTELNASDCPLYTYDVERDVMSLEPFNRTASHKSMVYDTVTMYCTCDNVYRIKPDESLIDRIAYGIEESEDGFYVCSVCNRNRNYLDYLSHKSFIGVLYEGDTKVTYRKDILSNNVNKRPLYMYMRYQNSQKSD